MLRRTRVAAELGLRQYLRNPLFVVLLFVLPVTFLTLSFMTTPNVPFEIGVREAGRSGSTMTSMPEVHGAIMVPITAAFLSGMVGLFVMLASREADRRSSSWRT